MRTLLIVLALATTSAHAGQAIDMAYDSNNRVQAALDYEICEIGHPVALSATERARFVEVRNALDAAYDASNGTDSAVEAIEQGFCADMGER